MEFEFDEEKAASNYEKHGVALLYGALIFDGTTVENVDNRRDYGEERIIATGMVDDELFVTVYVKRENVIRLISTRKGGRRDRKKYEKAIYGGDQGA